MSALMSFAPLAPEILLTAVALALLMLGAFQGDTEFTAETVSGVAIVALAAAALLVALARFFA